MQKYERVDRLACLLVVGAALIAFGCNSQQEASESATTRTREASSENAVKPVGQLQRVPSADASNTQEPAPQPEDDAKAVGEFNQRITEYMKLHKSLESTSGVPNKAEPETIAAQQKHLSAAIQAARQGARPGDIFSTAEPYFRRMVSTELRKDGGAKETVLAEGNPRSPEAEAAESVKVAVNVVYSEKAPVSTVPSLLLLRLPPLPEEINYRFVGRHLILHDIHANLILDYLLNVVP